MIHGRNLILALNGTPLAASKSCSMSKSSSFIEVAPPTAGDWEEYVPSKKGWKMSADCLLGTMAAYKTLDTAWKAGTALTMRFYNTEHNEDETGIVYIESLDLSASTDSLAKMSVSLRGSGALENYYEPITLTEIATYQYGYLPPNSSNVCVLAQESHYATKACSFTLTARTQVGFRPRSGVIIWSDEDVVLETCDRELPIYLEDNRADAETTDTAYWLNAGTYYVLLTGYDFVIPNMKLLKLS